VTDELYFNGRAFREMGFNEQQVRFFELLWRRAGGGLAPPLNLGEAGETIINIQNVQSSLALLMSQIKALQNQINELQNSSSYAVEGHDLGGYL
jgi:hypothetical protein